MASAGWQACIGETRKALKTVIGAYPSVREIPDDFGGMAADRYSGAGLPENGSPGVPFGNWHVMSIWQSLTEQA